jgi:hypothetical protein
MPDTGRAPSVNETLKAIDDIAARPKFQGRLGARLVLRTGAILAILSIGLTLWALTRHILDGQGFSFWPVIFGVGFLGLVPGLLLYICGRKIFRNGAQFGAGLILCIMGLPAIALGGFIAFGPNPRLIYGCLFMLAALALSVYGFRIILAAQRKKA